jgi:hypothetical protein
MLGGSIGETSCPSSSSLKQDCGSCAAAATPLFATALLALLIVSGCSAQGTDGAGAEKKPGTAPGVTIFGDARLGVVLD